MSEQQEKTDKTEKAEVRTASICPCCGKPTLPYPVKSIPDNLADQFMACLITGTPFVHTYPLYNGRVKITVTQMTADLRVVVEKFVHVVDRLIDKGFSTEGVSLDNMRGIARSLICVLGIEIQAGGQVRHFKPSDSVQKARVDLEAAPMDDIQSSELAAIVRRVYKNLTDPSEVSGVPPIQILATIEAHGRLLDILTDSGFDENFWTGIELA